VSLDQADACDFGIPAKLRARLRNSPERFPARPFLFAAPCPITLAAVALFVFMIALPKCALGQRHESEIGADP
jgi:hypothetical protein